MGGFLIFSFVFKGLGHGWIMCRICFFTFVGAGDGLGIKNEGGGLETA